MKYLWEADAEKPKFTAHNGDINTDVLIIGGGMAGVLCAMRLQNAGVDYLLAEAKSIGGGITKGTTAVITAQHDILYSDLIKKFGAEKAGLYLESNLRAAEQFRSLSENIACDFEETPSVMYSVREPELLQHEAAAVRSLGFSAEYIANPQFPFPAAGAVRYPGMAQFHPLKFLYEAAKNLNISENTFITRLEGTTAFTDHSRITAKKVIITTHFPFINRHGLYFMKLYQKRSYVIVLENAPQLNCTVSNLDKSGFYMRNYKNLLLIGGGDHRTGKKGGGFTAVRNFARHYFPGAKEKYAWSNQDCMSLDGVPYIGAYSPGMPNVYIATGFNEWGMTSSMLAAEILTDMVTGRENRFASVFNPSRSMITGQLFANLGETAVNFLTPTVKRCSHLGCALKWNPAEHSWDCPCHGSRFNSHGKLIDNPAMKDVNVK